MEHILTTGSPAYQRFKRLLDALGPLTLTAHEHDALARVVAGVAPDDVSILIRVIRKTRQQAFDVGRLNWQLDWTTGAPSRSLARMVLIPARR